MERKNNAPIMEALLYHYILGRGVGSVMLGVGHGRRSLEVARRHFGV